MDFKKSKMAEGLVLRKNEISYCEMSYLLLDSMNDEHQVPIDTFINSLNEIKKLLTDQKKLELSGKILRIKPALTKNNQQDFVSIFKVIRVCIALQLKHGINTSRHINEYLEWRSSKTGKHYVYLFCLENSTSINIDEYLLKGIDDLSDFEKDYIPKKAALLRTKNKSKHTLLDDNNIGTGNYKKIKEFINRATKDNRYSQIHRNTYIVDGKKYHEFNGSISELYEYIKTIEGFDIKESIFRKVASDFVKTYYRGNMPKRK